MENSKGKYFLEILIPKKMTIWQTIVATLFDLNTITIVLYANGGFRVDGRAMVFFQNLKREIWRTAIRELFWDWEGLQFYDRQIWYRGQIYYSRLCLYNSEDYNFINSTTKSQKKEIIPFKKEIESELKKISAWAEIVKKTTDETGVTWAPYNPIVYRTRY